jgi:hypothetical protein
VVIRGLSAAIVVFLAVEGGLAIFAGGTVDPDPNPYVLLLTCPIGAVFSEHIWEWAQEKLNQWFANRPETNGTPQNTTATLPAAAAPSQTPTTVNPASTGGYDRQPASGMNQWT